jgi:hypothetical protein
MNISAVAATAVSRFWFLDPMNRHPLALTAVLSRLNGYSHHLPVVFPPAVRAT